MRYLKLACGFVCFVVLASNVWSMSRWNEARGVYDDVCYLRQAHLFQRFGLDGLDTDISRDDDHYLSSKLKAIGFAGWQDAALAPCHTLMPATGKRVLQYPPGTGFVLAQFPQGFQVIPLYVAATVIVFGFAVAAIAYASTIPLVILACMFGDAAIYLMINPAKASYSMAPTMVACALAGLLTAKLLADEGQSRLVLTAVVGLVLGLSSSFRLPNVLLSAGYFLFFGLSFLALRSRDKFWQGLSFGAGFLVGALPLLVANAINAGNPFLTTHGGIDAVPPSLDWDVIRAYLMDPQFPLIVAVGAWAALLWRFAPQSGMRRLVLVVAGNLAVNLVFFATHPVFTPYYTIPISMLSLWTLLFAMLSIGDERRKYGFG